MSNAHNHDEHSWRRSISNTLRNKSNFLKGNVNNAKSGTLKKFVPKINNIKTENVRNDDEVDKITECLNSTDIQELIEKTITYDKIKETDTDDKKKSFNNNMNNDLLKNIDNSLNNQINNINVKNKLKDDNNILLKEEKGNIKNSINIYELNNISKNIYYNKKYTTTNAHFLPLTLPFFVESEKQKKTKHLFSNKDTFFFYIQLPNMLPEVIKNDEKEDKKNNTYNENQKIKQKKLNSMKEIKDKKVNVRNSTKDIYEISNLNKIPNGKIGKLIIYKNKKMKMKMNDILFDITEGSECTFSQEIGCYIKENSEFIFLGNCDNKLVVTPNIEKILNKN
ncbi:DNA-directed RNA polymerase III subunit RPC4, putative [Hepatocystis sp. ex Piliocolobus tephrosceles]|nr:DNA-directed RNA polymerase III subunit RPC4, putative [Hepatocystis sp. ex Piliocolobus tephrosceles]